MQFLCLIHIPQTPFKSEHHALTEGGGGGAQNINNKNVLSSTLSFFTLALRFLDCPKRKKKKAIRKSNTVGTLDIYLQTPEFRGTVSPLRCVQDFSLKPVISSVNL